MIRPLRASPEADEEFREAIRWYEERRPGLGADFLAAVREARELIAEHPEIGSVVPSSRQGERRLMVRRFPYQLIYYVRPRDVVLVAVAHIKRRPGYWRKHSIPPAT